jgi:hypothetical protein
MARINNRLSETLSVQGRVFDTTSKRGIDGLLVAVYDLQPRSEPDGAVELEALLRHATRVGSVLSDDAGAFVLNYDKKDLVVLNGDKRRLDLLVVVSAPDNENGSTENVIYFSNPPRANAGRVENFNIGISHDTLKKFGLSDDPNVKERLVAYKRDRAGEGELTAGIADFHRAEIERTSEEKAVLRAELLNTIATDVRVASLPGELVRDNDNIKDKVDTVTRKGVSHANTQIGRSQGVPVNLFFTPEDRVRLQSFFDDAVEGFATIPEHELRDILFRRNSSENPGTLLIHNNPIAKYCAEQTFEEKCAKIHTGLSEEDDHHHGDPDHPGDGDLSQPGAFNKLSGASANEVAAALRDPAVYAAFKKSFGKGPDAERAKADIKDLGKIIAEHATKSGASYKFNKTVSDAVWALPEHWRGILIEQTLAKTQYKGWFNVGQENRGFFPDIDFAIVTPGAGPQLRASVKSVNPFAKTYDNQLNVELPAHVNTIVTSTTNFIGKSAGLRPADTHARPPVTTIDIRVPPGSAVPKRELEQTLRSLVPKELQKHIKIQVSEF